MQNITPILFKLFCIFFILFPKNTHSQSFKIEVKKADSLYNSENFSKSLEAYESIITNYNKIPKSALIKIARTYEGMNNYSKAIYYLLWYKNISGDKRVNSKIIELTEKHRLKGYNFDDFEVYSTLVKKYRDYILAIPIVLTLVFSLLFMFVYKKSTTLFVITLLIATLFLIAIPLTESENYGIISSSNAYLTDAPTAGGTKLLKLNSGDRIKITDQSDIWLKTEIEEQTGWIRKNNILVIP